jgi:hypothetical protein
MKNKMEERDMEEEEKERGEGWRIGIKVFFSEFLVVILCLLYRESFFPIFLKISVLKNFVC